MNFFKIDPSLSNKQKQLSQNKFDALILELGVRHNNQHVGSGLGGNNFQLLVLMALSHRLVKSSNIELSINDRGIIWGDQFLLSTDMSDIRHKLDIMFPVIRETYKIMAAQLEGALDYSYIYNKYMVYNIKSLPTIAQYLADGTYCYDKSYPIYQQLMLALFIAANLANELDQGITKNISVAGKALAQFPDEIYLLVVRKNIGIDRLVNYNIDEHPDWQDTLLKITKKVN